MHVSSHSARFLLLLGASLAALGAAPAAADSPTGGKVARGKATITAGGDRTTIRQRTDRAVIDWKGFDVGRDHEVVFDQPGKSSATLNRVNSARRSVIKGALRAPGTVIIQNRAGVIFTETARIDAGGMVAASQDVDAARFQRDGRLAIGGGEAPGARVVNAGEITVRDAGLAALVGSDVENAGTIVARRGTVALASGTRTTIDLAGDGMVRIAVEGDAGGASNHGLIDVGDGRVLLSAGAASGALDAAINTTGVIRATSAHGDGGRVELVARGAGKVRIAGAIDASGARSGGEVTATGATVEVASPARLDANGGVDGGRIRLGGDRQGDGPLRRADHLRFGAGARIAADGAAGRGGEVVLWSEGVTLVDGAISATGAVAGGFVETSGRAALDVGGGAAVAVGAGGSWLLDPRDVEIGAAGLSPVPPGPIAPPAGSGAYTISRTALASTLNAGGDVTITTVQPKAGMSGDITLTGPLVWTGAGSLRLEAERDININATLGVGDGDFTASAARDIRNAGVIAATGKGDVSLEAGNSVVVNQNIRATGTGGVALLADKGDVRLSELRSGNLIVSTDSGDLALRSREGSVELRRSDATAVSNIQVYSSSGDVDVAAGTRILLEGGAQGGQWVRLGQTGSASDVTLNAPQVKLRGGSVGNTFAEVVSGPDGSISMVAAERIWVKNGAGDQARIQTTGGSPLTLLAETQIWDGPIRAGNGANNGGEVVVAGAITASFQPQFSLAPGFGFTFRAAAPRGTASSYESSQPFVVTTSKTGAIDIDAPITAQQITLESDERVGLGPRGRLTGRGDGDALVVAAGRQFRNESKAGADALAASGRDARWLLYVDTFAGLVGPAPSPRAFDLYGRSYDTTPPTLLGYDGNRIVYAERPTLTITGESLSKTYGTAVAPGYAVAGLRPGDSLATALEAAPTASSAGAPAAADAGAYATTPDATASDQGYHLVLADGELTIDPARLTVRADDKSRSYGAANPALTASASGFVLGQDLDDLDGTLALATDATRSSDVGSYAITASGLRSGNYAIAYADGALAVTPARLTVTPEGARSYGSPTTDYDADFAGFVLGQDASDLGGALAYRTPATIDSDAGSYALTASGLTSGNYAISYARGELTIDPARLTVRADDKSRSYGAANPALTASASGFVLGQDLDDLGGTLALATDATRSSDVGSYAITASGLRSGNYAIAYADGALAVTPARLTVTPEGARSYGSPTTDYDADFAGFVLGQDASDLGGALAYRTPATIDSDAGSYALTASGLTSGNYAISYARGALTIDPARLTVRADDKSRSYGAANPALTASASGFVLGQDLDDLGGTLALATDATRSSDVGSYAITASGLRSGNYAIAYADGALAVTPARLTVTPEGARSYGSPTTDYDADFAGFVLGQDASDLGGALAYRTPATIDSDAGSYALTASGLTSGNYAISYARGELTIDPARLTVRADDKSRSYGAANPALTASASGFVLGQDLDDLGGTLALATDATRSSDVGSYAITASGLRSGNYAIAYADGALAVTPARLTVTPEGARSYGSPTTDYDADFAGFVLGQDASDLGGALAYRTPATIDSDAGSYALTASGLTSGNYAISYARGELTIDPARLTVRADDAQRPEGEPNPRFTASFDGFVLGQDVADLDGALALATDANRGSAPGRYTITASGLSSGNYMIAYQNGLLTVRAPDPTPPAPVPTPASPIASLDESLEIYGRGAPPYTPGDSAFRTTNAEAPTALDSTFALTYSLGEIAQLVPPDLADTGGFTPASGGAGVDDAPAPTGGCSGPIAPAAPQEACVLQTSPESFWTTAFPGEGR